LPIDQPYRSRRKGRACRKWLPLLGMALPLVPAGSSRDPRLLSAVPADQDPRRGCAGRTASTARDPRPGGHVRDGVRRPRLRSLWTEDTAFVVGDQAFNGRQAVMSVLSTCLPEDYEGKHMNPQTLGTAGPGRAVGGGGHRRGLDPAELPEHDRRPLSRPRSQAG
jgi:hypothetical protein